MSLARSERCWNYLGGGCRQRAGNLLKRGDHVFRFCDNPDHDPRTLRDHLDGVDAWVKEAAADLQMDEDVVWHDVAVSYLMTEVHDPSLRTECARTLGIPADAF